MPSSFPPDGRRVVFYLLYDKRGIVDDYIPYKLEKLRPHAERIVVIVNGEVTEAGRRRLEAVADDVWERENVGFDVGGYQWALERFGDDALAEFDELVMMNYTWFGPVRPFAPIFERMEAQEVDFWGITDHAAVTPHPITLEGTMPAHIQSHWIAVRRSLFTSDAWRTYWREMPVITSYEQSIQMHESRFTTHFADLGFRAAVAFPHEDYPSTLHSAFEAAHTLIQQGCPVLKRRPFFHDPLYLDREAIIGRWLIDLAADGDYPVGHILQDMARNSAPKVLNTNASMLEIMPDVDLGYDPSKPLRIAATIHIFYDDMTDELLDRVAMLPSQYDLYITTTDDAKADRIRAVIAARGDARLGHSEVRVLPSNRGRDLSAFFIGVRDVLIGGAYDLIVKIHSKKTVQQGAAVGEFFKRQQIENLLNSPGYAANVLGMFQKEPGLGVVFPPTIHIGFPTLGGAWFLNKQPAKEYFDELGIHVPLDDISPLGPMGAMWIARPEAMALLTGREYEYEDYLPETVHKDGSLAHVQERALAYAAGELGFHTRTVSSTEFAAISHTFLEYKLDQLSHPVQGYAIDEVREAREFAERMRRLDTGGELGFMKEYFVRFHPGSVRVLRAIYRPLRAVKRRIRPTTAPPPPGDDA